jgi:hypothetical protein
MGKSRKMMKGRKPRETVVYVGSREQLTGFRYDKDKMEFTGLTLDGREISVASFSQTQYQSTSGKEKVVTRIQDKVVPYDDDLMGHLSQFHGIVVLDTNTRIINGERISACGFIIFTLRRSTREDSYEVNVVEDGIIAFRNCPSEMSPERYAWFTFARKLNSNLINIRRIFCLATDHDMDNHARYHSREVPIIKGFFLPANFKLMYARADAENQNILNFFIKKCDRESSQFVKALEETGINETEERRLRITEIPIVLI